MAKKINLTRQSTKNTTYRSVRSYIRTKWFTIRVFLSGVCSQSRFNLLYNNKLKRYIG